MIYMTVVGIGAYYFATHYMHLNSSMGVVGFVAAVLIIFFGTRVK